MNNPIGTRLGVYEIEDFINQGGMGQVFRARNLISGKTVALKRILLRTAPENPTHSVDRTQIEDRKTSLAREFEMMASLHHPHIVSAMDYGFDEDQQPYFTMQLLEKSQTIKQAAHNQPVSEVVRLLIEMLQAISYLHRRNVIHRDLKPDNVLVDRRGAVKVVDFGLAHLVGESIEAWAGTTVYYSPEVASNHPVTPLSDLFTAGVIAYELLTGRLPFNGASYGEVVFAIQKSSPDTSDIDDYLAIVIEKLLEKDPQKRYQNADEVIRAFSDAADLPVPKENEVLRESFLQAARFIGREKQMQQLMTALKNAEQNHGSAWLIGGESGVGKSRMMDELAIKAQVAEALVLRGHSVAEGGAPYQLWVSIVRRLAVLVELTDLEASILKAVVPNIGQLVNRPLPEAPRFEDGSGQQQLAQTLIEVLSRIKQPVLLLLEDLHWAQESLDILVEINAIVSDFHLLVVASYRDDERPDLPSILDTMKPLKLERLSSEETRELSQSMIGPQGAENPQIARFLESQTEGNAFFLVEVVRALAQEAGGLDKINQLERLPDYILTGGVRRILQQRLERVPEEARPLLRVAALASRFVDLELLAALIQQNPQQFTAETGQETGEQLERWLTLCVNATVIERSDDRWRFAHDKLRETLIEDTPQPDRIQLHRQIALAIEAIYPNDDTYAAVLAEHWQQAGDLPREAYYTRRAGIAAADSFAYDEALAYLERALAITPESDVSARAEINLELGMVLILLHRLPAARAYLETALALSGENRSLQAYTLRYLGVVTARLREPATAADYNGRALALFNELNDRIGQGLAIRDRGGMRYRQDDFAGAIDYYLQALAIAQETGDQLSESSILNNLGTVADDKGDFTESDKYLTRALEIKREIRDRQGEVYILNNFGYFAHARGQYGQALRYMQEALVGARERKNSDQEGQALTNLGVLALTEGRYNDAQPLLEQSLQVRQKNEDDDGACETIGYLGWLQYLKNDNTLALSHLQEAAKLAEEIGSLSETARLLTYLGHIRAELGQHEQATQHYQQAINIVEEIDHEHRSIERMVGLAGILHAQGQLEAALPIVNDVLTHLGQNSIDGLDEPFRLYFNLYLLLETVDLERARALLKQAYALLMQRAQGIENEASRKSYLESVPSNRMIVTLASALP